MAILRGSPWAAGGATGPAVFPAGAPGTGCPSPLFPDPHRCSPAADPAGCPSSSCAAARPPAPRCPAACPAGPRVTPDRSPPLPPPPSADPAGSCAPPTRPGLGMRSALGCCSRCGPCFRLPGPRCASRPICCPTRPRVVREETSPRWMRPSCDRECRLNPAQNLRFLSAAPTEPPALSPGREPWKRDHQRLVGHPLAAALSSPPPSAREQEQERLGPGEESLRPRSALAAGDGGQHGQPVQPRAWRCLLGCRLSPRHCRWPAACCHHVL